MEKILREIETQHIKTNDDKCKILENLVIKYIFMKYLNKLNIYKKYLDLFFIEKRRS